MTTKKQIDKLNELLAEHDLTVMSWKQPIAETDSSWPDGDISIGILGVQAKVYEAMAEAGLGSARFHISYAIAERT